MNFDKISVLLLIVFLISCKQEEMEPEPPCENNQPGYNARTGVSVMLQPDSFDEVIDHIENRFNFSSHVFPIRTYDLQPMLQQEGQDQRPIRLMYYYNRSVLGPILLDNPDAALEIPVPILVYEDSCGNTWTAHRNGKFFERRFDVDEYEATARLTEQLDDITNYDGRNYSGSVFTGRLIANRHSQRYFEGVTEDFINYLEGEGFEILDQWDHHVLLSGAGFNLPRTRTLLINKPSTTVALAGGNDLAYYDFPFRVVIRKSNSLTTICYYHPSTVVGEYPHQANSAAADLWQILYDATEYALDI